MSGGGKRRTWGIREEPANLSGIGLDLADQINGWSTQGVQLTKKMMWSGLETGSLAAAVELESHTQLYVRMTTQNFEEATRARKEGRAPDFAPSPPSPPADAELERARRAVLEKLGPTPVAVDEIIRQCQVTAAVALTVLLELDLAGRLDRHPGNQISLNMQSGIDLS